MEDPVEGLTAKALQALRARSAAVPPFAGGARAGDSGVGADLRRRQVRDSTRCLDDGNRESLQHAAARPVDLMSWRVFDARFHEHRRQVGSHQNAAGALGPQPQAAPGRGATASSSRRSAERESGHWFERERSASRPGPYEHASRRWWPIACGATAIADPPHTPTSPRETARGALTNPPRRRTRRRCLSGGRRLCRWRGAAARRLG